MRHIYVFVGSLGLIAAGAWMIIQPYALGFSDHRFPLLSSMIGGAIVVGLGIWGAVDRESSDEPWKALRHAVPTLGIIGVGVYTVIVVFADFYSSVGRFDAFYMLMVAMALIILGLSVFASRMAQAPLVQKLLDERNWLPEKAVHHGSRA